MHKRKFLTDFLPFHWFHINPSVTAPNAVFKNPQCSEKSLIWRFLDWLWDELPILRVTPELLAGSCLVGFALTQTIHQANFSLVVLNVVSLGPSWHFHFKKGIVVAQSQDFSTTSPSSCCFNVVHWAFVAWRGFLLWKPLVFKGSCGAWSKTLVDPPQLHNVNYREGHEC